MRYRVLYEAAYRAVWVTRSRPGVTVSGPPSRSSYRLRLPGTCVSSSSSRALRSSFRVSRATAGPALMSGLLPWASVPHRGVIGQSPQAKASHRPHRSVLDVSHVLDGFLLQPTSRVYFTPQPRPGFTLQGFPLVRSRTGSSPAAALLSLPELPTPSFTQVLRELATAFRAFFRSPVRRRTQLFRPRPAPSPPELHPPSGFPSLTVGRPSSPLRPRPFTAPVVLPVRDLTCSCEPAFPVQGSRPATPRRLAPSLRHEAA